MLLPLNVMLQTVALLTSTTPEAVTYRGTIGKIPVVVELATPTEASHHQVVGRYFYPNKGVDIPLDAVEGATRNTITVAEEKPCTPDTCDSDDPDKPGPLGATWQLRESADGATLTGTWS